MNKKATETRNNTIRSLGLNEDQNKSGIPRDSRPYQDLKNYSQLKYFRD